MDESSLKSQEDSAIGIISASHYSAVLETPENKLFVERYKAKYGEEPCMFSEQGYVAARVIVEALKATDGDTSDQERLLAAIRGVSFEAPRGPFKFDPVSQNVIFNTYIKKTEKKDGKLVNTVIETIPEVADLKQWN